MNTLPEKSTRAGDDDGFTLLEALVAIGILALVAVMFSVDYREPARSMETATAAMRVATELRAARSMAIRQSHDVIFHFSAEGRWYQVEGKGRAQLPRDMSIVFVSARPLVHSTNDARLVFFRDGSSTGGELSFRSGAKGHRVRVDWLTSKITVERQFD